MVSPIQKKWDTIYQTKSSATIAAEVLTENLHLLATKQQGLALEIACGLGANSLLLATKGYTVDAWDISPVAIEKLKLNPTFSSNIHPLACDVMQQAIQENHYDLIIVSRFLERSLIPSIIKGLKLGGLVFYQTYLQDKAAGSGPNNPRFLLQNNELLALFPPLSLVVYREEAQLGNASTGFRNEAMLIAQKPAS